MTALLLGVQHPYHFAKSTEIIISTANQANSARTCNTEINAEPVTFT
jgi:hypothetical protein